jgi:(p)ppGpp synthase/HD superfamily hydrolase
MSSESHYLTDLRITMTIGKNNLLDIITKASIKDVFIESVTTIEEETHNIYDITLRTDDSVHLENFIADLKSLPSIISVERKSNS